MRVFGLLLGVLMMGGCATAFHGSAPAGEGKIYVAGQYDGKARVWKCPSKGKGECETVEVNAHD